MPRGRTLCPPEPAASLAHTLISPSPPRRRLQATQTETILSRDATLHPNLRATDSLCLPLPPPSRRLALWPRTARSRASAPPSRPPATTYGACLACLHLPPRPCPQHGCPCTTPAASHLCAYTPHRRRSPRTHTATGVAATLRHTPRLRLTPHVHHMRGVPSLTPSRTRAACPSTVTPAPSLVLRRTATFQRQN